MQASYFKQAVSFSLAAVVTLAVLAGINLQAQPLTTEQPVAQPAAHPLAPKA